MFKYKIPFNKNLYVEQTILSLPYIYHFQRKQIKETTIAIIILISLGIIILFFGSDVSILFFCVAIFLIFDLYTKSENLRSSKDQYIRMLRDYLNDSESQNISSSYGIFEFCHDSLRLSDEFSCTWYYWSDFRKYKVSKSNLLLILKECPENVLVIGESEVSKIEFQKILKFIETKIK
ncbi:hypothetical protein [Seonamhaeicola marinus]|uniref:YcxB family protein n=1 Tax=Seonamhaeicola marinus TaxID=1912246 RepID=A0A5D0HKE8_9FLAO|nr:hypothetical protein [Seonamhaeicola marinus]TYA71786.1 hypothetical protein FUA24_19740 [Seonamhaeicola marinus]